MCYEWLYYTTLLLYGNRMRYRMKWFVTPGRRDKS